MRGNAVPIGFAIIFGVINGYSIFQPLIIEDRLRVLRERSGQEIVPSDAPLQEKSETVQATNMNKREAKKDQMLKADVKADVKSET